MFFDNQYIPTLNEKDLLLVQPDFNDFTEVLELENQKLKWNNFIDSHKNIWDDNNLWNSKQSKNKIKKKLFQLFDTKSKIQKQLKRLVRAGVPPELRGKVWWSCMGAAEKMTLSEEQYQDYLKRMNELNGTSIIRDIEKDLLRTFPDRLGRSYDTFTSPMSGPCLDSLKRILMAYAIRNSEIGYCQSMNYIAALLLFHMNEEMAFWCLACMIEDYLPKNYYAPSLLGGRVDQQVFQTCVAWKLPKLYAIFKSTNTMLEPIICPWLLCLYINVIPLYAVCRVWDCLFWEGSTVLFRIGLTLMRSKLKYISEANDFIEIYSLLKISNCSTHSFQLEAYRNSKTTSPNSSSSNYNNNTNNNNTNINNNNNNSNHSMKMSDSEFLIKSSFGYKWLRFIPNQKIEMLRYNFLCLLDKDHNTKTNTNNNTNSSGNNNNSNSTKGNDNNIDNNTQINRTHSGRTFSSMFTFSSTTTSASSPTIKNIQSNTNNNITSSNSEISNKVVIENPLKAKLNKDNSFDNNCSNINRTSLENRDSLINKRSYLISLNNKNINATELFALGRELDEGLSLHVEEFAKELLDNDEIREFSLRSSSNSSIMNNISHSIGGSNSSYSIGNGNLGGEWLSDIDEEWISDCLED